MNIDGDRILKTNSCDIHANKTTAIDHLYLIGTNLWFGRSDKCSSTETGK